MTAMNGTEGGDLSLKLLQLQCIIDAKDRELSSLRASFANEVDDPSGVVDQLREQIEQLEAKLLQYKMASLLGNGCDHGLPEQQRVHEQEASGADEVLTLNVSGHEMYAQRSTLLQVPGSMLYKMFAPGSSYAPSKDSHGRYFLPYQPEVFSVLLTSLQAQELLDLSPTDMQWGDRVRDRRLQQYTVKLVQLLGLQELFSPSAQAGGTGSGLSLSPDPSAAGRWPAGPPRGVRTGRGGPPMGSRGSDSPRRGRLSPRGRGRPERGLALGGQREKSQGSEGGAGAGLNVGLQEGQVEQAQSAALIALQPLDTGRPVSAGRGQRSSSPPPLSNPNKPSTEKRPASAPSSGDGSNSKPCSPTVATSGPSGAPSSSWLNTGAASAAVLSALRPQDPAAAAAAAEPGLKGPRISSASTAAAADLVTEALQGL